MSRPKHEHPTPGELEVLKILWERGPSTVREVMEVLKPFVQNGVSEDMFYLDPDETFAEVSKHWVEHYQAKLGPEEPSTAKRYFPNQTPRATYAAMISTLDEQVGLLLQKLEELGVRDDTLVMFVNVTFKLKTGSIAASE